MRPDSLEVYNLVRNIIYKPNFLLSKVVYALLQYNDIDKDDLIHDFMVSWIENPSPADKFLLSDRIHNYLRRKKSEMLKRPDQVPFQTLEHMLQDTVPDEAECSTSDDTDRAYSQVCSELDSLQIAVLKSEITMLEAATASGVNYDAFQKRLLRRKQKIRLTYQN